MMTECTVVSGCLVAYYFHMAEKWSETGALQLVFLIKQFAFGEQCEPIAV